MNNNDQRVIVVGGGILGTAIALGLSRRGAEVTVLEAASLGSGTTSTSYAWLNANGKEPHSYYAINRAGIEAHQALAAPGFWTEVQHSLRRYGKSTWT